jgi:hypothetical protein
MITFADAAVAAAKRLVDSLQPVTGPNFSAASFCLCLPPRKQRFLSKFCAVCYCRDDLKLLNCFNHQRPTSFVVLVF